MTESPLLRAILLASFLPSLAAGADAAKTRVDLYVMSLCPFGVQAENGVIPAVKSLAPLVELRLHFIGGENPAPEPGRARFNALHGPQEVAENIRQLCALKLAPAKALDYILERNKDYKSLDWRAPARAAGLDETALARCTEGPQGAALLSANLPIHRARQAFSSPTIDIDDVPYTRSRAPTAVLRALCDALAAKGAGLPKACAGLPAVTEASIAADGCGPTGVEAAARPAPPPVAITAVVEQSCALCGPTLLDTLTRIHPGAKTRTVDARSDEGRRLIARHGTDVLPLYVLDKNAALAPNFPALISSSYARSHEDYIVRPGANSFLPTVQLKRKRGARHLDLFLSSLSPASASAERDLARFLSENVGKLKDLSLSVHFVVHEAVALDAKDGADSRQTADARAAPMTEWGKRRSAAGELTAPRGEPELRENLLQVCLFQHAPVGDFFAYLDCRAHNLGDAAQAQRCLRASERVSRCVDSGEGMDLLRRDARLARELGVNRDPALLWENRYGPFGWNEVDWKRLLLGSGELAAKELPDSRTQ